MVGLSVFTGADVPLRSHSVHPRAREVDGHGPGADALRGRASHKKTEPVNARADPHKNSQRRHTRCVKIENIKICLQ